MEDILKSEGNVKKPDVLLRQLRFQLRERTGQEIIVPVKGGFQLAIPCDVSEFLDAARRSRVATEEGYRREQLTLASALYAGEFMPDYRETWAGTEAIHLEAEFRRVKRELGELPEENPVTDSVQFVGRHRELAELEALLKKHRLLTLAGPGGAGKTRLAHELARKSGQSTVVNLAEAMSYREVIPAVLKALGLPPQGRIDVFYSTRPQALLVLDNAEHLVSPELRTTLTELLQRTEDAKLHVLVTSRRVLELPQERVFPLAMLPVPPVKPAGYWTKNRDALMTYPSVQLFRDAARRAHPQSWDIGRSGDNVAEICRRVDGSPLALLLIASRINTRNATELATRDMFELLEAKRAFPGDKKRHSSLYRIIHWSADQLPQPRLHLLASLSVFAGSFSTEAVEAVTQTPGALASESLLEREYCGSAPPRWKLHQTVKEYLTDTVERLATGKTTKERLVHYYCTQTELAAPQLRTRQGRVWLNHLELEYDNLRQAIAVASPSDGLRIALALTEFYVFRGRFVEGAETITALSRRATGKPLIDSLLALAQLRVYTGELSQAMQHGSRALELATGAGDTLRQAHALRRIAIAQHGYNRLEDTPEAKAQEALALYRKLGKAYGEAGCLNLIGLRLRDHGNVTAAREHHEAALRIYRGMGDIPGEAMQLLNLAKTYNSVAHKILVDQKATGKSSPVDTETYMENFREAIRLGEKSYELWRAYGDMYSCNPLTVTMAWATCFVHGRRRHLEELFQAGQYLYEIGERAYLFNCLRYLIEWHEIDGKATTGAVAKKHFTKFIQLQSGMNTQFPDEFYASRELESKALYKQKLKRQTVPVRLTDKAFEAAWTSGRNMTLDNILTELHKIKL